MFKEQANLSYIAPTNTQEAHVFAARYLEPQQHGAFVEYLLQGGTLYEWLSQVGDKARHEILTDCLCTTWEIEMLPYAERLQAIREERTRFEAWRSQHLYGEPGHVC